MANPIGFPQCTQVGCTSPPGVNQLFLTQGRMAVPYACADCFTRLNAAKGPEYAASAYARKSGADDE